MPERNPPASQAPSEAINISRQEGLKSVSAETVRMQQSSSRRVGAGEIEVRQSMLVRVDAQHADVKQSTLGSVRATNLRIDESKAGFIQAQEAYLADSQTVALYTGSAHLADSIASLLVARNFQANGQVRTGVLLAQKVDGQVSAVLDTPRAILAGITAGVAFGLVVLVGRLLSKK